MGDVELAELVATRTAERLDEWWRNKVDKLQEQWRRDIARLRDDLTIKGLIHTENCGVDCPLRKRLVADIMDANVLLVDDFPQVLSTLSRILRDAGITTHVAKDSDEAVKVLQEVSTIDVVLADVSMPKNGYTLLEYVREHFPTIEVIMISGFDDEGDKARKMGAFGFLSKPFSASQALLIIEKAVEMRRLKLTGG